MRLHECDGVSPVPPHDPPHLHRPEDLRQKTEYEDGRDQSAADTWRRNGAPVGVGIRVGWIKTLTTFGASVGAQCTQGVTTTAAICVLHNTPFSPTAERRVCGVGGEGDATELTRPLIRSAAQRVNRGRPVRAASLRVVRSVAAGRSRQCPITRDCPLRRIRESGGCAC